MHRHFWKDRRHHGRDAFDGGHGRGPFGGGRHGRRGGRIGRLLEHGDLRFVVLALLAEQPRHGYDLMKELEDRTGGAYRPSPGVIYPTLSLLEDEGFVRQASAEAGRKLYEITDAGKEALEKNRLAVDAVFARMGEAAAQSDTAAPRVKRAMGNLALALRYRMSHGSLTEAEVDAIAKAIDEAAAAVERV
jgi:DNA-binding PadR family transcriptional regulator